MSEIPTIVLVTGEFHPPSTSPSRVLIIHYTQVPIPESATQQPKPYVPTKPTLSSWSAGTPLEQGWFVRVVDGGDTARLKTGRNKFQG